MHPSLDLRRLIRVALLSTLVITCQLAASMRLAHAEASPTVHMTADDLSTFFDSRVPNELTRGQVAGAAVAVVRDGKILFVRGYGHADVARGIPVSGTETLFRIASLSKVFTYTAVMQLVERGQIDLDRDIAAYLDFPVPKAFGQPVTMRHLMTHTAGFDETIEDRWIQSGSPGPLRDYVVRHMPRKIYPPGSTPSYSSYGTALAAYIVERVSGETFDHYVESNILGRLGMRHTSFQQPLPEDLAAKASKNYMSAREPERPFEITQVSPSAGASSTAADMAKFMLAHLSAGELANKLFGPGTRARMHTVAYRHHPSAPGVALGVYEMELGAGRVLGHHGDIPLSNSAMYLFADGRTGLFVVQNSGVHPIRTSLLKQFGHRYFPLLSPPAVPLAAASGASSLVGSYMLTRSYASSPLYMSDLLTNQTVIRQGPGASLIIGRTHREDGRAITWRPIAENVWQSDDGSARKYFRRDLHGNWVMGHSSNPTHVDRRLPWYQHPHVIMPTLTISLAVLCLHLIWRAGAAVWRRRASKLPSSARIGASVGKVSLLASVLTLSPWLLYAATAVVVLNHKLLVSTPAFGMALRCIQVLSWAAIGAIGLYLWAAVRTWRATPAGWGQRAWQSVLVLAALGLATVALQGNLLLWDGRW
ncbi:serine hydrolase domain-containing protein [Massilia niabensis]|uniref:Serine hydrolase domain-containing protein n=1 Tax=Massilia niabensis TaxID=544910 RepID=A0ABW0L6N8_9BURK